MIVKNEEAVMKRCLSCVQTFADEIIVVDTGSVDRTVDISREMGAKIYDYPWGDDFAAARNYSFSKATMEFQMWLDADDVIDEENQKKMSMLKETLDPSVDVIFMHYEMNHQKEASPVIFDRERLVKKGKHFVWEGRVHETLKINGKISYQDITIKHKKEQINDPFRNLRIFEKMRKEQVQFTPRDQYYYARELQQHNKITEAVEQYECFLKREAWTEDQVQACYELGSCYLQLQDRISAFLAYTKSFFYAVPTSRICNAIGCLLIEDQRYMEAAYWYEQAIRSTHRGGFENQDEHDFLPGLQLAICYYYLNEKAIAKYWFDFAKKIHPNHPLILENDVYFK